MEDFQRSAKVAELAGVRINEPPYDREVLLLASPLIARRSTHFAMGISVIEPGKIHEEHRHEAEETIFVLSGIGEIEINGREVLPLEPETVVVLKSGEPHGLRNKGDEPLRCLWVYAPSGSEAKFVKQSPDNRQVFGNEE